MAANDIKRFSKQDATTVFNELVECNHADGEADADHHSPEGASDHLALREHNAIGQLGSDYHEDDGPHPKGDKA